MSMRKQASRGMRLPTESKQNLDHRHHTPAIENILIGKQTYTWKRRTLKGMRIECSRPYPMQKPRLRYTSRSKTSIELQQCRNAEAHKLFTTESKQRIEKLNQDQYRQTFETNCKTIMHQTSTMQKKRNYSHNLQTLR